MNREQWDALNELIFGRWRSTGYLTEHAKGNKGINPKTGKPWVIAVVDNAKVTHMNNCYSPLPILLPEADIRRYSTDVGAYYGIVRELKECIVDGVDFITLSMSGEVDRSDLRKVIQECDDAGIKVFTSAGNEGDEAKRWPACYETTFSCGSVDNDLLPSQWASHGEDLTFVQFGQNTPVDNGTEGEEWVLKSGDSFTTNIIMATGVLAASYLDDQSPLRVKEALIEKCIDLSLVGKDNKTGYGFPTMDMEEFFTVKSMIFDYYGKDLSWRVMEIKSAMIENNMTTEEAEAFVNPNYHIVGYEDLEGIKIPIYGGRKW